MKNQPNGHLTSQDDLKTAILLLLRHGMSVDMLGDAAVFIEGKDYVVAYQPNEYSGRAGGFDEKKAKMMDEDGEMTEYFDTPEEATNFFLKIRHEYGYSLLSKKSELVEQDNA